MIESEKTIAYQTVYREFLFDHYPDWLAEELYFELLYGEKENSIKEKFVNLQPETEEKLK
jgi:hypothetical protein